MDKSAIRNFAIEARKILMKSAETEAGFYGVTRDICKKPIQKGNGFEVYETLAGTENRIFEADIRKRANLVKAVEALGFEQVMEETAYTWFNRMIAIRFMEVNGYLPTRVRVLSSETGSSTPDIVTQFLDMDLNMASEELEAVQKAKDENRYDDAFRMLFVKQCNELNAILPGLFEKTDDYMELLLRLSYTSDGVVRMLVDTIDESNFKVKTRQNGLEEDSETEGQVEIIGWMYQYYNTELKDDTFAKLKKNIKITKERIPAATQLFTPDWIVRYMVENSVGRVWIEHLRALDSSLDEKKKAEEFGWRYYLPEAEQEEEVQQKLVEIRKDFAGLEPKDINCIDPCMGSGHILVYMFDVLMDIYKSEGFGERESVFSILENNIRGLDIDKRAYQLSYFALMMKAREYNRTFFRGVKDENGERRFVEPIVFDIEESNDINREQLKYFGADMDVADKNAAVDQVIGLLDALTDAKEYGSILDVEEYDWELLKKFATAVSMDGQISFDTLGLDETQKKLRRLIAQGQVMAGKYWVVSTNPPYMGISNGNEKLNGYVKKIYPDSRTDLFAVFIEKCQKFLRENGLQAMITQHSWMFLASFEKLRIKMQAVDIVNMAHLGARAFEEIGGEVVQTTSFVIQKEQIPNYRAVYCRLIEPNTQQGKESMFLAEENRFICSQEIYRKIEGSPVSYWISKRILKLFEMEHIDSHSKACIGMRTGNNDRYLRLWFEVCSNKCFFKARSADDVIKSKLKWVPYNKGGEFRKWYGNQDYMVNWQNNGFEIKENTRKVYPQLGENLGWKISNETLYFKRHICWTDITTKGLSFRLFPEGFIFDASANVVFETNNNDYCLLAFLNSKVIDTLAQLLNPTLHFKLGNYNSLPALRCRDERINLLSEECVELCKADWDSYETSWDFRTHPFLSMNQKVYSIDGKGATKIHDSFGLWKAYTDIVFEKVKHNEEELNSIFINIYGLQNELSSEVKDKDITVHRADLRQDVSSFISYAVGCMFGRYSLDSEGLVYAGGEWKNDNYITFFPNKDGIIVISDSSYFSDDILTRFVDFVRVVYGEETLEENLSFIANALGNKGDTSREVIRAYFLNDFYKNHCNTYSVAGSGKRPIYWLFDSGKQNGFKALIYMHRYTKDTLNLLRSEYLRKTENAVENALKNAEYIIQTSTSAVEKAKATKKRDKYVKQLNEMHVYYQALSHMALQKIEIDLDDGVKHNYQLFQGVEVVVDGGKKQVVDLLAKL